MKRETLERLIREYKGPDAPHYVVGLIEQEQTLAKRRIQLHRELNEIQTRFAAEKKHVRQKIADLQAECPHHEIHVEGDPSGGSDRSRTCELCGADVRR